MEETEAKNYNIIQGESYNSKESLMYQLENNDIIDNVFHALRCEKPVFNEETNEWTWIIPEGVKPLINKRGAESIIVDLRARINKIFILSDLDDEHINTITNNIAVNIIDELTINWDLYEIDNQAAASRIVGLVTDSVYATLRKAKSKNYLTYITKTSQRQEVLHSDNSPKQGGAGKFLDSFMPGNYG